jgi:hypothetical protein
MLTMISPVSGTSAPSASHASQTALPKNQPQESGSLPQDTVSLKSTGAVSPDGNSK